MKKVKILRWLVKLQDGEVEDSTLTVLKALINFTKPEEMPRGLDNFNLFKRLSEAFDKAEKNNLLELEDYDYTTLKRMIEKNIPSFWGMNKDITKVIDLFIKAEE